VWQLECQASSVTASVQSDHVLHEYMLPVFIDTDQSRSRPYTTLAVLKFSRRRNKLLPQASTRPHTLLLQRATDAVLCVYVKQYYVKRLVTLFEFIGAI